MLLNGIRHANLCATERHQTCQSQRQCCPLLTVLSAADWPGKMSLRSNDDRVACLSVGVAHCLSVWHACLSVWHAFMSVWRAACLSVWLVCLLVWRAFFRCGALNYRCGALNCQCGALICQFAAFACRVALFFKDT
jgi:hypothetical protein